MTARAKEAVVRIVERIPHKDVAYAFLELEASNVNEFVSLREEALEKIPMYGFAASAPRGPLDPAQAEQTAAMKAAMKVAKKAGASVEVEEGAAEAEGAAAVPQAEQAASASTPTEEEKLSPREIARARLLAKKGA